LLWVRTITFAKRREVGVAYGCEQGLQTFLFFLFFFHVFRSFMPLSRSRLTNSHTTHWLSVPSCLANLVHFDEFEALLITHSLSSVPQNHINKTACDVSIVDDATETVCRRYQRFGESPTWCEFKIRKRW
jgi:hypothetical protein